MCYRCFWPVALCWCDSLPVVETATRFVVLMHPKEFKREKAGTGRLTHLCLPNSEIQVGVAFDRHPVVQRLLADPDSEVVLLYPGSTAIDVSDPSGAGLPSRGKRLVVLVLDATWSCARKMLKLSPSLQRLPRMMFRPSAPSRFVIKQQPWAGCLSTLESVYEVIRALNQRGVEATPEPERLLAVLDRMQQLQIAFARDPDQGGYRRGEYSKPADRRGFRGHSARRRANFFRGPEGAANDRGAAG